MFALSIKENIKLGHSEKEDLTEFGKVSDLVGLTELINALPRGIGTQVYMNFDMEGIEPFGVESHKMAIAHALYKEAPIVILDEPTAVSDHVVEYEVYSHVNELAGGKTSIYISRDFLPVSSVIKLQYSQIILLRNMQHMMN